MDYAKKHKIPLCLLTIDAEKAFDAVLAHTGISPFLLNRIEALYTFPSARIKVNGNLSDA